VVSVSCGRGLGVVWPWWLFLSSFFCIWFTHLFVRRWS
jgi:hypothetical protein